MAETSYSIGEGPATHVSLSLPEGTVEAIRRRVGKREFSSFIAAAVERELAGHERRNGPLPSSGLLSGMRRQHVGEEEAKTSAG
ncbi:hypothetical protein [Nonomuraea insulae]|uniref:Ribbon-helix-helix protein CopG domain-containing protein n=1 Tax=Nonomuraea insulae TaxID=1616787 RepID=A0ABW1D080_9ACTN